MISQHQGYDIEAFEAGRSLWHARIRRTDKTPIIINGYAFPTLEVGFAWDDPDAAIDDARRHIDRFKQRWETPDSIRAA